MTWDFRGQPALNDPIEVVEHDPRWVETFERERGRLSAVLGDSAIAIEHVGSTAVPGLAAKRVAQPVLARAEGTSRLRGLVDQARQGGGRGDRLLADECAGDLLADGRLCAVERRPVSRAWLARYLALLGLEREPPGLAALERLVRAQGELGVFENVTAILRRARVPSGPVPPVDLDALLRARAAGRGGGVCFELAPLFRRLLTGLGYRVWPILAQITFPGSYHATVVDLDGARYLVDVGSGAPLWRPLPLLEPAVVRHAGLGFRFRPDGPSGHLQERLIHGAWEPHCRYDLAPAGAAARAAAYQRHQEAGRTWVVGNLTLVRCTAEAVYRLHDDELVTYTAAGTQTERLEGAPAFRRAAAEVFGLPRLPVSPALAALDEIRRRGPISA